MQRGGIEWAAVEPGAPVAALSAQRYRYSEPA